MLTNPSDALRHQLRSPNKI